MGNTRQKVKKSKQTTIPKRRFVKGNEFGGERKKGAMNTKGRRRNMCHQKPLGLELFGHNKINSILGINNIWGIGNKILDKMVNTFVLESRGLEVFDQTNTIVVGHMSRGLKANQANRTCITKSIGPRDSLNLMGHPKMTVENSLARKTSSQ